MKKLISFCLLLTLPMAAVEDDQVMYAGGTAPALRAGVVGRLDTTSETSLSFDYSGAKLLIPYADIQSFEYSTEVTRHLGVMPRRALKPLPSRSCALERSPGRASHTGTTPTAETKPERITIPAGTHLLMKLISPLHTTSSTIGSGVYLETVFPVVANDRVVIPDHTRVMGMVADERRPGRVQGRAQIRLKFTQMILPDDRELSIAGNLQSLPGSNKNRTVNHEGTIEPVDQIDADVYTVAKTTGVGVLGGAISHAGPAGIGYGALIGGGLGLAKVLFTRGEEISLPVGTRVEMVLQHPLTVQPAFLSTLTVSANAANHKPEPTR